MIGPQTLGYQTKPINKYRDQREYKEKRIAGARYRIRSYLLWTGKISQRVPCANLCLITPSWPCLREPYATSVALMRLYCCLTTGRFSSCFDCWRSTPESRGSIFILVGTHEDIGVSTLLYNLLIGKCRYKRCYLHKKGKALLELISRGRPSNQPDTQLIVTAYVGDISQ